jgi:hypothetical protein
MVRGRSAVAGVLFFGTLLVCATGAVLWWRRGTMPDHWLVSQFLLAGSWVEWRSRHLPEMRSAALYAFFWSMFVAAWAAAGETLLAATAAVPAIPSLLLAVIDARDYLASDEAPRPPADPALAARLRLSAIPLWAAALLSLAAAAALGWQGTWVPALTGVTLAALFGILAWLQRRGARPRWALPVAGILGCVYAAIVVLALGGSLRDHGLGIVLGLAIVAFLGRALMPLSRMRPRPYRQAVAGAALLVYGGLIMAGVAYGLGPVVLLAVLPAFLLVRAVAGRPRTCPPKRP